MITARMILERDWHLQTAFDNSRWLLGTDVTPSQRPAGNFKMVNDQRRIGNVLTSVARQLTANALGHSHRSTAIGITLGDSHPTVTEIDIGSPGGLSFAGS